jgi:DNA polymerase-3 subunit epsilon
MTRQIFFDTETTGLSPEAGDRIIEIGCVEFLNRRPTGNNKHFYINPERANHEDAVKIHGLTDEFLADKPLFAAIADELMDYLSGAEIVIHNAGFDVGFMDAELKRLSRGRFLSHVERVTDSLVMAREMFPGKSNSLDALCKRLEVDNSNRTLHGALLDAGLLAEVYIQMTRGQEVLVIDATETSAQAIEVEGIDFGQFELVVLQADQEELIAHEGLLAEVDKSSKGKTIWRTLVA